MVNDAKWFNKLWFPQSDPRSWYNVDKIQRFFVTAKGQGQGKPTDRVHNYSILAN